MIVVQMILGASVVVTNISVLESGYLLDIRKYVRISEE